MKVVRCPGCRGASRVAAEAIGLQVVCPRCRYEFQAVEEAATIAAPESPAREPRPQLRLRRPPVEESVRSSRPTAEPVVPPDSHHTAHGHSPVDPIGRLPISVFIGLALLPFVVPLVWVIAPLILGQPPMLSVVTPIALALAASALCLAVVYTVDWSPTTRIKGVLMLVGLAYFAGLSLYFLKKEMVDKAREFVGPERDWKLFQPPAGDYRVRMPSGPKKGELRLLDGWKLDAYRATHKSWMGPIVFVVGSAEDPRDAKLGDEQQWFDAVKISLLQAGAREPMAESVLPAVPGTGPGRQFEFRVNTNAHYRVVQVYRAKGRLYYLSAEGNNLDPKDDLVQNFFESFMVLKD